MPTVSLHTLGCRLNQAETAIIAKKLQVAGYEVVEYGRPSDLTVINTCTVTGEADAKCRQAVRKSIRKNPDTFVAVIGCYAQMDAETISRIHGVDLIIGNQYKFQILDYLDHLEKQREPRIIHSRISRDSFTIDEQGLFGQNTRANLKIQDGCSFVCSFCIIAKARGPARSREFDDILREARQLAASGHRELILTGVNIGTYNNAGRTFLDLIRELETIPALERVRISSIEPTTVDFDLIDYMAGSEKMCRYLHIPLQSGDDRILESMRRKHTAREFADIIEYAVKRIPDVGIGTDIMVGYPGEGDAAFRNTKKLLADLPVAYFHVFNYSDRKGTASWKMEPKVDHHIRKERARIMIEMGNRKKHAFYNRFLDTRVKTLFEDRKNGQWSGLTDNYIRVHVHAERDLYNTIRSVKLVDVEGDHIRGECD